MTKLEELSAYRLNGDPVPRDLAILVPHADELEWHCGIRIGFERDWAPWTDKSYLTDKLSDPDIRANVQAHDRVFNYIAFFAEQHHAEYLGYWRGPSMRPVAQSPLVFLNNEGQFTRFPRHATVASVCASLAGDSARSWLESLDVGVHDVRAIGGPDDEPSPGSVHGRLYKAYCALEGLPERRL